MLHCRYSKHMRCQAEHALLTEWRAITCYSILTFGERRLWQKKPTSVISAHCLGVIFGCCFFSGSPYIHRHDGVTTKGGILSWWQEPTHLNTYETPWKTNGWNLQITHEKKGKWSEPNLQGIMCKMLIFKGCISQNGNLPIKYTPKDWHRTWKWWDWEDDFPLPCGVYPQVPAVNLPGCRDEHNVWNHLLGLFCFILFFNKHPFKWHWIFHLYVYVWTITYVLLLYHISGFYLILLILLCDITSGTMQVETKGTLQT